MRICSGTCNSNIGRRAPLASSLSLALLEMQPNHCINASRNVHCSGGISLNSAQKARADRSIRSLLTKEVGLKFTTSLD